MSFIFQLKPLCSPFWPVLETRLLVRKGWDREYVFLTMPGSVTKIYQTGLVFSLSEWAMTYAEESLLNIMGISTPLWCVSTA